MNKIKILDCTLRDGGYINAWEFSNKHQKAVIKSLIDANVEIIECGYLNDKIGKEKDSTLFSEMKFIDNVLASMAGNNSTFVIMVNLGDFDISKLPNKEESKISGIRLAFHKKDIDLAYETAEKIIKKGYELFVQPMVSLNYTDSEMLELIKKFNQLDIHAFYIVDSFGSMTREQFKRLYYLIDNNLKDKVTLGFHAHNNMQLSYSNAMDMVEMVSNRRIIIDTSVFGMGRGAGNLNTEIFVDYLNRSFGASYKINPLLEIIDNYLEAIYYKKKWGFSVAYYLSAIYDCHPNYANFYVNKKTLTILAIEGLLYSIENTKKDSFDVKYAEKLYLKYNVKISSTRRSPTNLFVNKDVFLVASGSSVSRNIDAVNKVNSKNGVMSISLNHIPTFKVDYCLFTNQKRYVEFVEEINADNLIISSNITPHTKHTNVYTLDHEELILDDCTYSDNVASLILNYLVHENVKHVYIAGLDGYDTHKMDNYYYEETDQMFDVFEMQKRNEGIACFIRHYAQKFRISFVTPSMFEKELPLKILGVIPARYKSSRFEGKPLVEINGIPMLKRTHAQAIQSKQLDALLVATEDQRIVDYCESENIPVLMTSSECLTGTDRIAEVAQSMDYDLYINIQGDEPVIDPDSINEVVEEFRKYGKKYMAYNLYKIIDDRSEVSSPTIIKTIVNTKDELMYMSRAAVPFSKTEEEPTVKKQVCVYGFTKEALEVFSNYTKTLNEKYEDIEILRFIDLGYKVKMRQTEMDSIAVDVPSDIQKVENFLNQKDK